MVHTQSGLSNRRSKQSGTNPAQPGGHKGFALVSVTLGAFFLLGMAGMGFDIGRMYITKNEAQSFVDSAALDAALQLDGTTAGLNRAVTKAGMNSNQWKFGTTVFPAIQTTFSTSISGPWDPAATASSTSNYVRVGAQVNLPVFFLPAVTGAASSSIAATAVAGRVPKTSFTEGVFPFSPYTHKAPGYLSVDDPSDPFGMLKGRHYTIRWAASPSVGHRTCPGDDTENMINLSEAGGGSERGYFGPEDASSLRTTIESSSPMDVSLSTSLPMSGGAMATLIFDSIEARVQQDSDSTSPTYAEYKAKIDACGLPCTDSTAGNGRRVVMVPVNGGHPGYAVLGFAGFFLLPTSNYTSSHGNSPGCAEYIGIWTGGSPNPGGGGSPGAYVVRLVE